MGRRALVFMAAAVAASCSSEAHLPLPAVEGVVAWVVVASTPAGLRAEVLEPEGGVRLEVSGGAVEALAFTRALGVAPGPLARDAAGDLLPTPARVFAADVDALAWAEATASPAAAELRLPAREPDCPRYAVTSFGLSLDEPGGVHAIVRVDEDTRLAVAPTEWFTITRDEIRPITPLVPGVQALAREPDSGDLVLARGPELWVARGDDLSTATATLARVLPGGLAAFSLAIPRRGVAYGLVTDGRLFRSDTSTTVVVHRFAAVQAGSRGMVIADGTGVVAGLGPDGALVHIDEAGTKRTVTLPSAADGVVSIARFAELGLVIGTNNGELLAESLRYQPVPDPLGQMPRGSPIRALRPFGDRLLFGGGSGTFGEITAQRFVCKSSFPASATVRALEPLGDQILAAGLPLLPGSRTLDLTRFTAAR